MELLGIDNIFFEVGDIDQAIDFYQNLGLQLKFKIPHISGTLFSIGREEPGLLIRQSKVIRPSHLWIEVLNAHEAQKKCASLSIVGKILETATGFTFETIDPWKNIIGFADYTKKPELARK